MTYWAKESHGFMKNLDKLIKNKIKKFCPYCDKECKIKVRNEYKLTETKYLFGKNIYNKKHKYYYRTYFKGPNIKGFHINSSTRLIKNRRRVLGGTCVCIDIICDACLFYRVRDIYAINFNKKPAPVEKIYKTR